MEVELDLAHGTMAVLSDNKFGNVGVFVIVIMNFVIVWTVKEDDKVGVLLDGTRITKVGQDWAWIVAAGDVTGKLCQGDDWNFELASENFKTTRNFGDFLNAVSGITVGALNEL